MDDDDLTIKLLRKVLEAWDAKEKIAEGRHERFVVPNLEKFLDRALKKGQA